MRACVLCVIMHANVCIGQSVTSVDCLNGLALAGGCIQRLGKEVDEFCTGDKVCIGPRLMSSLCNKLGNVLNTSRLICKAS